MYKSPSAEDASIEAGETQPFIATGTYSDSSTADLTGVAAWSSTDDTIATFRDAGIATGLQEGTVGISASFLGVTSNSATLVVTAASASGGPYLQVGKVCSDRIWR